MKSRISALMDGELDRHEAAGPLEALGTGGEPQATWRSYHLIGDAMRNVQPLSTGFADRVAARLAAEPTVLAPSRLALAVQRPRWQFLSAAASLAAVALVGWVAFGLEGGDGPQVAQIAPPKAQAPSLVAQKSSLVARKPSATAQVPPPEAVQDYLYAHQGYSPRNSLQGVAPYVRTVSGDAGAQKR